MPHCRMHARSLFRSMLALWHKAQAEWADGGHVVTLSLVPAQ